MYSIVLFMSLACLPATGHPWHAKPWRHGDLAGLGSAELNSSLDNPFNGAFRVESVPSVTEFLVTLEVDPGTNPTGTLQWASQNSTPLTVNGTTATFATVLTHGLAIGQGVKIEVPFLDPLSPFKGFIAVTSIPSQTAFRWEYASDPGGNGRPGYQFAALWQVGQFVAENNVIEVVQTKHLAGPGESWAIAATGASFLPQYTFRRALVRDNIIRPSPGMPNPDALAVQMSSVEHALVERNIVDLANSYPIRHDIATGKAVRYFGNQNPAGQMVQGAGTLEGTSHKVDELATAIDDAIQYSI